LREKSNNKNVVVVVVLVVASIRFIIITSLIWQIMGEELSYIVKLVRVDIVVAMEQAVSVAVVVKVVNRSQRQKGMQDSK
jgi:Mg2+/citrate symporter